MVVLYDRRADQLLQPADLAALRLGLVLFAAANQHDQGIVLLDPELLGQPGELTLGHAGVVHRPARGVVDTKHHRRHGLFLGLNSTADGHQVIEADARVVIDQLAAARLVGTDRRRWLAGSTVECLYL